MIKIGEVIIMDKNKCRVTICGQSNVGKTCLINRIAHGFFDEKTLPTISTSKVSKTINLTDGGEIDFVAEKMAILHTFRWRCQLCLRMFWNGN